MKTLEQFHKNYELLGDAVVKSISVFYTSDSTQFKVVLDCMAALKDYQWIYLEINFYDVQEFKIISMPKLSIEVVESFAATCLDDLIVFNFAPNIIPPESILEHRDSAFYIICKEFDFKEISVVE